MAAGLSPQHRKWLQWFHILAGFASVQMVIQVLGFLSGILIVRHLSKPDYAWFTIANALIATLGMIADSGVSAGLSSIGGTIWQDGARFGSLIRTALALRRKFALVTVILVTPIFTWLLVKNQAPAVTVAIVVAAALVGFSLQLTGGILGMVMSLRQEIRRLQLLGLGAALARLVLVASACIVLIDLRVVVIIGVIGPGFQLWFLRRWVREAVNLNAPETPEYRDRLLTVVKKQLPLTLFYCLQGQVIVWLISIFGSKERIAEIGALGRFAMIFTVVSSVMNGVVVPRFARCQDLSLLRRRYWQIVAGFAAVAGALVILSAAFPRPLLWVLGGQYANLESEVWLMMLSAALAALFATQFALTYSKAWIAPAIISIPMEIVTQAVLIFLLDMTTVRGVLLLGCCSFIPPIFLNMIIAHLNLRKAPVSAEPRTGAV